jgi:transposase
MHHKAKLRIAQLERDNAELQAKIRLREQQLFGHKTEAGTTSNQAATATTTATATPRKPRGQQRGQPGPTRRDHSHLPAVVEIRDLPDDQQSCSGCGVPFAPFAGTEDSEVLEVEVKAYRRILRRKRYRPTCSCGKHPGIVTAPQIDKVFPRSTLGVSIWTEILLDKFLFYRPTHRLLADWKALGLDLSLGTITGGLQRLLPLLEPVYQALIEHNQRQVHWHADETRWSVFATQEGKVGYRWWLWAFHSAEAVAFVLSSGRAHDVPEGHLGPLQEGILSVDRYAAYKAMQQVKGGLVLLAFCWAHVRRDFLSVAKSWPTEEGWALGWVERIGQLYQANAARLEALERRPQEFAASDDRLRQQVDGMAVVAAKELAIRSCTRHERAC